MNYFVVHLKLPQYYKSNNRASIKINIYIFKSLANWVLSPGTGENRAEQAERSKRSPTLTLAGA